MHPQAALACARLVDWNRIYFFDLLHFFFLAAEAAFFDSIPEKRCRDW
jgi:hypothetical protein